MNGPSLSLSLKWRRVTTIILITGLVAILVALIASYAAATFRPTVQVKVSGGVYNVWLADNEIERIQGLSGVDAIPPGGGLLMDFEAEGKWGIWMKDMKVPIDIVWISNEKKVVYIVKNASPELGTDVSFTPTRDARYVLELPAGSVDTAAIRSGHVVEMPDLGSQ